MTARMRELIGLLTLAVERVRAANHEAESRAARMSAMLDALADENAVLRADLDRAEDAAAQARDTIRSLREEAEAARRLAAALETRAADAELRIARAAEALGLPVPADPAEPANGQPHPSAALH